MATIAEKLARFENAKETVEVLVAQGVDLKSQAATPAGLEMIYALDQLAQEFGYKILKPIPPAS